MPQKTHPQGTTTTSGDLREPNNLGRPQESPPRRQNSENRPVLGEFGGPRDAARRFSLGPPGRKAPPFSRLRPPPRPPAAPTDPACRARGETRAAADFRKSPAASGGENGVPFLEGLQPAPRNGPFWTASFPGPNSPPTAGRRRPRRDFARREAAGKSVQYFSDFREFLDFPEISENSRKFPEISGISENARKWGSPAPTPHASETDPTCPYTSFWRQRLRI